MRIVVLGGGFAGMEAVRVLERRLHDRSDVEILLISDRNYLLFTPLLPQVASSMVEPRHIVQPLRDIRGSRRFRFRRDTVTDIDFASRRVLMVEGTEAYDRLVIAMGSVVPSFGVPGVEEYALGYKWLEDGIVLRDHLLDAAEHADHEADPAARRQMLTVCVVGGGYTGVELIAELQDFFTSYIVPRYRGIEPGDYRLLLLEAGQEILRGVHPTLAERARRRLWHEGIEIRTGARVTRVEPGVVEVGTEHIPVGLTVWAAGVKGHPTLAGLAAERDRLKLGREGIEIRTGSRVTRVLPGAVEIDGAEQVPAGLTVWAAGVTGHPALAHVAAERDRLGRLVTRATMQLKEHPDVYGAGDAVTIEDNAGASIPIIPAALAQARLAAENIVAELQGRSLGTIHFAPQGMLVSLGERDAVVEVLGLRFSGYAAWLFWNALHLVKLVGFRKQLQVALDWGMAQIFPRDSTIMRPVSRCPVCGRHAAPRTRERDAA